MNEATPTHDTSDDDDDATVSRDTAGVAGIDHELLAELSDDFAARYRRGERPLIEDYAQRHPELARHIRELFPAMLAMEQSGLVSGMGLTLAAEGIGATNASMNDFPPQSGTVTFAAGQTSRTLTIMINGDRFKETDNTFFVNLSHPVNAVIADGQGGGTIKNDD